MAGLYEDLLLMYMKRGYVLEMEIEDIEPEDENYFKPLKRVTIGEKTEICLREWESQSVNNATLVSETVCGKPEESRYLCRNFLIQACIKMKEMCDFEEDKRMLLNPCNVSTHPIHMEHPSLNVVLLIPKCRVILRDSK
ncbi:hypothetical protein QAD02_021628 [Eretmocerus hayati]|uniref:Uncharacterized protein n=1 Tax=Eretmocerus hayati TaxID=131215 RepID=A0ACC2PR01_9HYME|nr:hypothetical protein QAD02_021628 [Eretmocerus hayati]